MYALLLADWIVRCQQCSFFGRLQATASLHGMLRIIVVPRGTIFLTQ
jgi:hypothetical protein